MESKQTDLTEEELEAIAGSMNDSAAKVINASGKSDAVSHDPVSYPHLTLPTILRV